MIRTLPVVQTFGDEVTGRLQELVSLAMEAVLELKQHHVQLMPCTADTWLVACFTRLLKSLLLESPRELAEQGKSHGR